MYFLLEVNANGLDTFPNGDNPEPWLAHLRNYTDSPAAFQICKLNFPRIILIGLKPQRPGEVVTRDACASHSLGLNFAFFNEQDRVSVDY